MPKPPAAAPEPALLLDGCSAGELIGTARLQQDLFSHLDYPAGSAWTRRIRRELAIAGIPEAASLLGLIGCGVI
jgi:hypothetical protein